jgi:hypothetical protein
VVAEAYRKYRLADVLTQHMIEEAARRRAPGLMGIVERINSQSRVTHIRNGFREVWRGTDRIVFARELGQAGYQPAHEGYGLCQQIRSSSNL